MFDEFILHGDTFYSATPHDETNVLFRIRLPWYRCLPISVLDKVEFTIDGKMIPEDNVRVLVNNEPVTISEVKRFKRIIWSNLETQTIRLSLPNPIAEGAHEVHLELRVDLPYKFPKDDPPYYYQYASYTKTMTYVRG